jgi:hypothetical protein
VRRTSISFRNAASLERPTRAWGKILARITETFRWRNGAKGEGELKPPTVAGPPGSQEEEEVDEGPEEGRLEASQDQNQEQDSESDFDFEEASKQWEQEFELQTGEPEGKGVTVEESETHDQEGLPPNPIKALGQAEGNPWQIVAPSSAEEQEIQITPLQKQAWQWLVRFETQHQIESPQQVKQRERDQDLRDLKRSLKKNGRFIGLVRSLRHMHSRHSRNSGNRPAPIC